jgi:Immunity protein 50
VTDIQSFIDGSNKLTEIFGYWPTFHDAEIIDVQLWRGDVEPRRNSWVLPVLTVKLHVWQVGPELDPNGYCLLQHSTLTTLRFHDVEQFRMNGFNHQNPIFGLQISRQERADGRPTPLFGVEFDPVGDGNVEASFQCSRVEVVDATPCAAPSSWVT